MTGNSTIFIDSLTSGCQSLMESLTEPYEVYFINGDADGLGQMAARGNMGVNFITSLAQLTGADVAATDAGAGTTEPGGDWMLRRNVETIQSAEVSAVQWRCILADTTAPTVTTFIPTDDITRVTVAGSAAGADLTFNVALGIDTYTTSSLSSLSNLNAVFDEDILI